ncbi:hypothetical protein PsYK624_144880 [Phanerochaete sordida]|uniref:Uncharacterized protein n=1 Tax=Phanerochaete sordida TaxID=48140 RepID=A0A9P3LLG0_9APHY|nr:hypothetical protein PsYK624_144880 [Phanerochaete sordida]
MGRSFLMLMHGTSKSRLASIILPTLDSQGATAFWCPTVVFAIIYGSGGRLSRGRRTQKNSSTSVMLLLATQSNVFLISSRNASRYSLQGARTSLLLKPSLSLPLQLSTTLS